MTGWLLSPLLDIYRVLVEVREELRKLNEHFGAK